MNDEEKPGLSPRQRKAERLGTAGLALFFGSFVLAIPVFGIGHIEDLTGKEDPWHVPWWLSLVMVVGMALMIASSFVGHDEKD